MSVSTHDIRMQILQLMVLAACIARARMQMVIIFANALKTAKEMAKVKKGVIIINFNHMLWLP